MKYLADLPMHESGGSHDFSAEDFTDGLVSQAHAKNRRGFVEVSDNVLGDAGVYGSSRSGRNDDARGLEALDFFDRDLVVAMNAKLLTQLAKVLHEVVGEGVVVIDHQNHSSNPRCARLIARIKARDLLTVSMYSFSGTESATMPPPAWMYPLLPRTTRVRMAMQESRLLLKSTYITAPAYTPRLVGSRVSRV